LNIYSADFPRCLAGLVRVCIRVCCFPGDGATASSLSINLRDPPQDPFNPDRQFDPSVFVANSSPPTPKSGLGPGASVLRDPYLHPVVLLPPFPPSHSPPPNSFSGPHVLCLIENFSTPGDSPNRVVPLASPDPGRPPYPLNLPSTFSNRATPYLVFKVHPPPHPTAFFNLYSSLVCILPPPSRGLHILVFCNHKPMALLIKALFWRNVF